MAAPVDQERRYRREDHRSLVGEGVSGNEHPASDAVEDRHLVRMAAPERGAAREAKDAANDQRDAAQGEKGGAFAEEDDGGEGGEQRPGAARQRVDERKIPGAI